MSASKGRDVQKPDMVIEFVEDEAEDFDGGSESESESDREDYGEGEEEDSRGNRQILEAIESLGSLQLQTDEGGVEHIAEYKRRTKELLERLLRKLTEDVAYQRGLEDQLEVLEDSLADKDAQIAKLSAKAHRAIDDCKAQAEEMAEDFMSKVEMEVSARSSLESIIRRQQCELSMFKAASRASKADPSRLLSVRVENESLKLENESLRAEFAQTRASHDAEMATLGACCESLEKKFRIIKVALRKAQVEASKVPP